MPQIVGTLRRASLETRATRPTVALMRAAFVAQLGPADTIQYGTLPDPVPAADEVLVDVVATTVNPVDTFVRSGAFPTEVPMPLVMSRDLVGQVAAPSHGFTTGEWVWSNSLGHGGRQGAAATQAAVPANRLYRLPPEADPTAAVAVVHPGATAYLALFTHGALRAGARVLIVGGAGNVGSAAITMAVAAGAEVHTTASAQDLPYCASLGATPTDYRNPRLPSEVDLYVDCAGINDLETAIPLLAPRGRVVLLAGATARPVLPVGRLYTNDCSIAGFVISHATVTELTDAANHLTPLLAKRILTPRAIEEHPLSAMAETHNRLEQGALHGRRAVLHP
jgi:NADPH:quinone reductase-like Zn-dependent oxidoreductase